MTGQLAGRKALVTGGARGIGAAIARALAKAGASVMIGDILEDAGRETAAEPIAGRACKSGFVKLDVTDDASGSAAVAATVARARRLRHPHQQRRHRDHFAGRST